MADDAFTRDYPWESTFIAQMERRRKAAGWTQTDLARKLKVRGLPFHQQTVQRVEKGERAVRLDEAYVIAEIFEVSLDAMLTHYEGPMEDAATAIDRVRRHASSLSDAANDDYLEFLNEFDQLVLAFDELLKSSSNKGTTQLAWLAAWIIKSGRLIDAWSDVQQAAAGLYAKSGDWVDMIGTVADTWGEVAWVREESEVWKDLPEASRPRALAELSPGDLQQWMSDNVER